MVIVRGTRKGAFAAAGFQDPQHRDSDRHGGGFVAFADQVQHPVTAQSLGVVLDPNGGCLAGTQGVDAKQVGQGTVVNGDRLCNLEEPDKFEAVQSLRDSSRCTFGSLA
jgi:hypothetical protein